MTTTVTPDSVTAYVTDITGTVTSFIREEGLSADEKTFMDARETAAALVAGVQTINLGAAAVGTDATGLVAVTNYNLDFAVDGGTIAEFTFQVGGTQTVQDLVDAMNTDFVGATVTLAGGKIVVTSDTTGNDSDVYIAETASPSNLGLIASITVAGNITEKTIESAVKGNLATDLVANNHKGQSAWNIFKDGVETYDSASPQDNLQYLAAGETDAATIAAAATAIRDLHG